MARMIPSEYDEASTSNAEKRVFRLLEHDPDTSSWTVIHSLGLTRRGNKPYGEIDFVVIIPGGGIICLEVKGGRVSCFDGTWYSMDRYGKMEPLKRSPFMQAREGMFELRKALKKRFGEAHPVNKCLTGSAVIFPDLTAPPGTTEFEPWEVIDLHSLRMPISHSLKALIEGQRYKFGQIFDKKILSEKTVKEVCQFLRPNFERIVALSTAIERSEKEFLSLTEEQYSVLDLLSENQRCFIEGAAGTGKTLLALEYAKRSANSGKKTLLLCFNKLIGSWLRKQVDFFKIKNLKAGNYHKCLRQTILATSFAEEFIKCEQDYPVGKLFNEAYPFYGELALLEGDSTFDTLVIDEGQDLLKKPIMDILNAWLKGGLAGGNWAIFGDLTRQAIFASGEEKPTPEVIEQYCRYFTKARLTHNCRNTKKIGEETALISGFDSPPYRLGQIEGLPVDYRYWKNEQDQKLILQGALNDLLRQGIDLHTVVILSPFKYIESIASKVTDSTDYQLCEIDNTSQTKSSLPIIYFSTIQAFKGMESPVVIICDISRIDTEEPQSLLYVAMSRARSHLIMLLNENTKQAMGKATARKLMKGWLP